MCLRDLLNHIDGDGIHSHRGPQEEKETVKLFWTFFRLLLTFTEPHYCLPLSSIPLVTYT